MKTSTLDFVKLGIIKRKLTRKEARTITDEIMAMKIDNPSDRFVVAICKAMEVTLKSRPQRGYYMNLLTGRKWRLM